MRAKDFSFYRRVPLEPGDYVLEAAVRDRRTRSTSIKKISFQVPSSDDATLLLSSIVLSKDSVIAANEPSENFFRLDDPLRLKNAAIVPDASGVYRKSLDKDMTVFFRVGGRNLSGQIPSVLEFIRDGATALKLEEILTAAGAAGQVEFAKKVGLDQLKPGQYEVKVTAGRAGESGSAVARFRVEP